MHLVADAEAVGLDELRHGVIPGLPSTSDTYVCSMGRSLREAVLDELVAVVSTYRQR